MAKKRKLLLKAYNNPRGLRFAEFTSLVESFGFEFRRQVGSHRIFARTDVLEVVNVQPTKDGKAKDVQVEDFLKLVERYGLSSRGCARMSDGMEYPIAVFHTPADGLWVAKVPDLPGCSAHGETPEEAVREVRVAMQGWLEVAREIGKPIPAPSQYPAIAATG